MSGSATALTLEQYLATSYRPDVEFVDGELKDMPVVSLVHGRTQILLGLWFGQNEDTWGVQTLAEARTQVSDHSVRLPDVIVMAAGPLPKRASIEPPLLAIEVLSESDREIDLKSRVRDLEMLGTKNIWLIDPEARTIHLWAGGAWQPFKACVCRLKGFRFTSILPGSGRSLVHRADRSACE